MISTMTPPWLLLVHVLPGRPTNLRVKTWRRLQDLGAVALKNAVWALPHTAQAREDLEWMRSEILQMGGEATVMAADGVDAFSSDQITAAFQQAREPDYAAIEKAARALAARPPAARLRDVSRLSAHLARLEAITFFPPANRDRVTTLVAALEAESLRRAPKAPHAPATRAAQGRLWVTRPRPGVDRMASAWLIRRFIDAKARFGFADRIPADSRQVPFDMFGVEFGHSQHGCTFETLVARFALASPALDRIARIVHDVDLKDARFQPLEAPAFVPLIDGLRQTYDDDHELLERGMTLFEALYRAFGDAGSPRRAPRRRGRRTTATPARKRSSRRRRQ